MTRRDLSDSTLDALAQGRKDAEAAVTAYLSRAEMRACQTCDNLYLEGYPHHHEQPLRPGYDPMPVKPSNRVTLIATIRAEYLPEIPNRLHVHQVPSRAEPIGVSQYSAEAAGFVVSDATMDVLDSGELGSPPWSVPFHSFIGSYTGWEGEMVRKDEDLYLFPWTRNLEGVRRWCASKHRAWYEHRGDPICWTLVQLVTAGGYSVGKAGKEVKVPPETAERLLFGWENDQGKHIDGALDKWWTWVSQEVNGLSTMRVKPRKAA